ncbi:hypothetical protein L198_03177, partial [Cryptococcus wingfieldii CBS 7118]
MNPDHPNEPITSGEEKEGEKQEEKPKMNAVNNVEQDEKDGGRTKEEDEIGGEKDDKEGDKPKAAPEGGQDVDQTGSITSHDTSVDSTPGPRVRQGTPWPDDAPNPMAMFGLMAGLQQQMAAMLAQQQSTPSIQQQLLDLLAQRESAPAPPAAPAPAENAPATSDNPDLFRRPDKLTCPTLTRVTRDPFV